MVSFTALEPSSSVSSSRATTTDLVPDTTLPPRPSLSLSRLPVSRPFPPSSTPVSSPLLGPPLPPISTPPLELFTAWPLLEISPRFSPRSPRTVSPGSRLSLPRSSGSCCSLWFTPCLIEDCETDPFFLFRHTVVLPTWD